MPGKNVASAGASMLRCGKNPIRHIPHIYKIVAAVYTGTNR